MFSKGQNHGNAEKITVYQRLGWGEGETVKTWTFLYKWRKEIELGIPRKKEREDIAFVT